MRLTDPNIIVYTRAKTAVEAFTRVLAQDVGKPGITANSVAPGFTAGPTNAYIVEDPVAAKGVTDFTALNRFGQQQPARLLLRVPLEDRGPVHRQRRRHRRRHRAASLGIPHGQSPPVGLQHRCAVDIANGRELLSADLPAVGAAMPISYVSRCSKRYIVIAAGGHFAIPGPQASALLAYALP